MDFSRNAKDFIMEKPITDKKKVLSGLSAWGVAI